MTDTIREESIAEYTRPCSKTLKAHDWRYASYAPGWLIGDGCVLCQDCKVRGISPAYANERKQ